MNKLEKDLKEYLKLKGYSPKTQSAYFSALRCYERHFGRSAELLGNKDAKAFLLHLIRLDRASSTLRIHYSALRVVYEKLLHKPEVMYNIPIFKKDKKRIPIILSRKEIKKVLEITTNKKHRAIIAIAYSAGLRVSEVVNLRVKDIDKDRMVINIRKSKNGFDRTSIFSHKAREILRDYYKAYRPENYLFPGMRNFKYDDVPVATATAQRAFLSARRKAGIIKEVTFHSLRHSFATHLLEDGTNILFVQKLLGHSNLKTTLVYLHATSQTLDGVSSPFDKDQER